MMQSEDADIAINARISALDQKAGSDYCNGRYDDCIDSLRVVYQFRRKILGPQHVDTLLNLNNLASALGRAGKLMEAEEAFREVLTSRMKVRGPKHAETFTTMNHLGVILKQLGQFEEADSLLFIALEGFFAGQGPKHICTAEVAYTFAVLAVQQGRRNKAAYLFALAHDGLKASLGEEHQHTKDAAFWAEKCYTTYTESAQKPPITTVRSPHSPCPTPFELEDMDFTEGIYASKKEWAKNKVCRMCNVAYSLIRREHHCRVCGGSVCDDCSQGRTYMEEFGLKGKSRCCNVCTARGFD